MEERNYADAGAVCVCERLSCLSSYERRQPKEKTPRRHGFFFVDCSPHTGCSLGSSTAMRTLSLHSFPLDIIYVYPPRPNRERVYGFIECVNVIRYTSSFRSIFRSQILFAAYISSQQRRQGIRIRPALRGLYFIKFN